MKTIRVLTGIALAFTLLYCEDENDNIADFETVEIGEVELNSPQEGALIELSLENADEDIRFEWEKAEANDSYVIMYEFLLDQAGENFTDPLFVSTSADNGTAEYVEIEQADLDLALESAGVESGAMASLSWAVRATAQNASTLKERPISIQRFTIPDIPQELYLSGSATEVGDDPENGLQLRRLYDANGNDLKLFEGYSSFSDEGTFKFYAFQNDAVSYGGEDGNLSPVAGEIPTPGEGIYRIRINFLENTYELFQMDWSIVGNVIPSGWGGDYALEYQGNGVWQSSISMVDADAGDPTKRFIFRANQDWGYIIKKLPDSNVVYPEDFANTYGYTVDDIPVNAIGDYTITLSLSGTEHTYSLTPN